MDNCFHNWGDLKTVLVGDILPPYIYNDLPKNIKEPLIQTEQNSWRKQRRYWWNHGKEGFRS